MAVGNDSKSIYLSIADGKIVRRFKEPTANSKQRTSKTGKIVHEESYDFVSGIITDISTKDSEYGKFWNVRLQDGSDTYVLQFQYSGGNASSFLKAIPNADLNKEIKIKPRVEMNGDKKRTTVMLIQDDTIIRWKWTKDNPGDLPSLKKVKVKGVEQWDDSDMMEALEAYIDEHVKPKLKPAVAPYTTEPIIGAEDDNDVPF
jgi:hypothetical protein